MLAPLRNDTSKIFILLALEQIVINIAPPKSCPNDSTQPSACADVFLGIQIHQMMKRVVWIAVWTF